MLFCVSIKEFMLKLDPIVPFFLWSPDNFKILIVLRSFTAGSRTIAPEENCPSTPKLTLSQTLTLTRGQFSSWAIVWLPPNPKTNPDLDPNPSPNQGGNFPRGQLAGYLYRYNIWYKWSLNPTRWFGKNFEGKIG